MMRDCSCGAKPGEAHHDGCPVARCLWTGLQAIACDGSFADIARQLRADGHDEMAMRLARHLWFSGSYILDVGRARAIGLVKRGALRVLP